MRLDLQLLVVPSFAAVLDIVVWGLHFHGHRYNFFRSDTANFLRSTYRFESYSCCMGCQVFYTRFLTAIAKSKSANWINVWYNLSLLLWQMNVFFCLYFGSSERMAIKLNLPHLSVLARDLREQNDKTHLCYNFFKGMLCKVKFCSGHSTYVSIATLANELYFLSC